MDKTIAWNIRFFSFYCLPNKLSGKVFMRDKGAHDYRQNNNNKKNK